jgi:hypothetical protein
MLIATLPPVVAELVGEMSQDDREECPVDQVVDDRCGHDQRADRTIEETEIQEDSCDDRVGGVRQVHADEHRKREEVFLNGWTPERSRGSSDPVRFPRTSRQQPMLFEAPHDLAKISANASIVAI